MDKIDWFLDKLHNRKNEKRIWTSQFKIDCKVFGLKKKNGELYNPRKEFEKKGSLAYKDELFIAISRLDCIFNDYFCKGDWIHGLEIIKICEITYSPNVEYMLLGKINLFYQDFYIFVQMFFVDGTMNNSVFNYKSELYKLDAFVYETKEEMYEHFNKINK
mgnify:CR=1 FL=1|jgi:hypothetical protein